MPNQTRKTELRCQIPKLLAQSLYHHLWFIAEQRGVTCISRAQAVKEALELWISHTLAESSSIALPLQSPSTSSNNDAKANP